jgi:NadR type nicotinamide-nucleotide adenylyltransferase
VTVTGAECTGKTTLVRALAERYGAPWVPEAARLFVDRAQRTVRRTDVFAIARLHRELLDAALESGAPMVLCDTDLLSTVAYARHYFGSCPRAITRQAFEHPADLYLLAADDVPWIADPHQRGAEEDRSRVQARLRSLVRRTGRPFVEVGGSVSGRLKAATRAIDRFRESG